MNGKKAKLLRKLAGVNSKDTVKHEYGINAKQTRLKEITNPHKMGVDGKPEVLFKYRTVTNTLTDSARKLYKILKSQYLASKRYGSGMSV